MPQRCYDLSLFSPMKSDSFSQLSEKRIFFLSLFLVCASVTCPIEWWTQICDFNETECVSIRGTRLALFLFVLGVALSLFPSSCLISCKTLCPFSSFLAVVSRTFCMLLFSSLSLSDQWMCPTRRSSLHIYQTRYQCFFVSNETNLGVWFFFERNQR